jgi:chorismate mutase
VRRQAGRSTGNSCVLAFLFMTICGCAAVTPQHATFEPLLALIDQRLAISEEVARSKWNSGAAVEDLARENEIVEAIGRDAGRYGLDAAFAKSFFRAQIEASKLVQNARLAQWRATKQPPFADAPDLQRDIRPQLDRLTPLMLDALSRSLPALHLSSRWSASREATSRSAP